MQLENFGRFALDGAVFEADRIAHTPSELNGPTWYLT